MWLHVSCLPIYHVVCSTQHCATNPPAFDSQHVFSITLGVMPLRNLYQLVIGRGAGDSGWGCAYRNLQMMISNLTQLPRYEEVVQNFKGKSLRFNFFRNVILLIRLDAGFLHWILFCVKAVYPLTWKGSTETRFIVNSVASTKTGGGQNVWF